MQCQKCGKEIPEGKQLCAECELAISKTQFSQSSQPNLSVPNIEGGQPSQNQVTQPQPAQSQPIVQDQVNLNQPNSYITPNVGSSMPGSKNIIKVVVAIVVALITFFGIKWFQGEQKWGTFKKNYSSICESESTKVGATQNQAETYCSCTLDEMQDKYSRDEIYKIDEEMQSNEAIVPDELMPIITDCANKVK